MKDREPIAWLLNLDAEHELEARGPYAPTQHMLRIVARERRRLVGSLVRPGDVQVEDADARVPAGMCGVAWSPTPSALARLSAAGARVRATPALDVLRRVNARPFTALLRQPFTRDSFDKHIARNLEEALVQLERPAPLGWLVRREFGAAGRGRRRLGVGVPSRDEQAWLVASLRLGLLVIEPWARITREYTRSSFVCRDGNVLVRQPCLQETTAAGAWSRTEAAPAGSVAREDDERLEESAVQAGRALAAEGYFGPYGIDAFRHRRLAGAGDVLNPLSEINARFTMDWTLGMGPRGDELLIGEG